MTVLDIVIQGHDAASIAFDSVDKSLGKLGGSTKIIAAGFGLATAGVVAVGAAAVGAGIAALNLSSDINNATNKIAAQMGISKDAAAGFEDVMKSIYANNFGESFDDIGAAVVTVSQNLGGFADINIQGVTEDAFALRDAFGIEVSESVMAAKNLMTSFGLDGEQAMDFIASGMQNGLNASDDFIDSIGEYGNLFSEAGFSAEQMYSIMATGAQTGVLGTDKIADAVKEMGIILLEGGDDAKAALDTIGLSFDDISGFIAGGDEAWADYFDDIVGGLSMIEDPMERAQAQTAIFGTMAEDLGPSFTEFVDSMAFSLEDMAGATEALNAQYDNWPSMFEGIKRNALLALEPLGDVLLDIGNQIMPIVQGAFMTLSEKVTPIIEAIARLIGDSEDRVGSLANIVYYLGDAFGISAEAMQPLLDKILGFRDIFDAIAPAIETFKQHLASGNGLIVAFTGLLGNVLVAFGLTTEEAFKLSAKFYEITTAIRDAVAPIIAFVAENLKLKDILVIVGAIIAGVVLNALAGLIVAIAPVVAAFAAAILIVSAMRKAWETDFGGIRDFVAGVWSAITLVWEAFKRLFEGDWKGFLTTIGEAWETAWSAIVEFLSNLWDMARPHLEALWRQFTTWFNAQDWAQIGRDIVKFITDALSDFDKAAGAKLLEWKAAFWTWVASVDWKALATTIIQAVVSGLETFDSFAKATLTRWWQVFSDWATDPATWRAIGLTVAEFILDALDVRDKIDAVLEKWWQTFVAWFKGQPWDQHGETVTTGIKEGLAGLWSKISESFSNMWSELLSWFTEPGKFNKLGHSIIEGMKAGIEERIGAVRDTIQGLADWLNNIWQTAQKSHSPSRVWWQFGRDLMIGLAMGIAEATDVPENEIEKFINNLNLGAVADVMIKMAQAIHAIAGAIRPAIEALRTIGTFDIPRSVLDKVEEMLFQVNWLVRGFAAYAYELGGSIKKAENLIDVTAKIGEIVVVIIETLQMIKNATIPTGLGDKYKILVNEAHYLTLLFGEAAATMEKEVFPQIIAYIEAVTSVFGLVELAITSMQFLTNVDMGAILKDGYHLRDQMVIFRNIVRSTMREFSDAASELSGDMSAAVGALAEAAGKVFEIVELVIEKAAFLSDTDFGPILKDGYHLHNQTVILRNIVRDTMRQFAEAAKEMTTDGMAAIEDYIDAATAVFGLVEIAIETTRAIADYVGIEDLVAKVDAFATDIDAVVVSLAEAFRLNRREGGLLVAAAEFSEEIVAMLNIVKPAIDALVSIGTYAGLGDFNETVKQVQVFEQDFNIFVEKLIGAMWNIVFRAGGLITATNEFAPKIQEILNVVTPAIDAMRGIADYIGLGDYAETVAQVQVFEQDFNVFLEKLIRAMWNIVGRVGGLITATEGFAAGITTILGVVRPALDALASIADYVSIDDLETNLTTFMGQLEAMAVILVEKLNAAALVIKPEDVETASGFAQSINAILTNISGIFRSLSDFANSEIPGGLKDILTNMVDVLRSSIPDAALAGYDFGLAWINGVREAIGAFTLDMPGGAGLSGAAAGAATGGGLTTNLNLGGLTFNTTIANGMDEQEFHSRVIETIRSLV